ncbi:unnamed protein product [Echinostoma caproni]|uniref:CCR4-NOT transcription complex subunit 10 n=1 Tax=Echinostoma caproni TaxID=27848 RepID=A0A183A1J7_9TREM|nr:unnamed protein product [Echinostoma caproni]
MSTDLSKSDSSPSGSDETTLSAEAAFYFTSKQYEKCGSVTKQLLELKPNDPKVIMNKALLDFVHKHNFTHADDYVSELKRIASIENIPLTCSSSTGLDETGKSSGTGLDTSDSDAAAVSPSTSGLSKSTLPQSMLGIVLQYNFALVLFYQRQYCKAERILANCLGISRETGSLGPETPCFQAVSGIELTPSTDVTLSRRVVLLWLEVLLRLQHPEEVYDLCGEFVLQNCILSETVGFPIKRPKPPSKVNLPFHVTELRTDFF